MALGRIWACVAVGTGGPEAGFGVFWGPGAGWEGFGARSSGRSFGAVRAGGSEDTAEQMATTARAL